MERIEYNLLKAQIEAQDKEIKKIYEEIEDRKKQLFFSGLFGIFFCRKF